MKVQANVDCITDGDQQGTFRTAVLEPSVMRGHQSAPVRTRSDLPKAPVRVSDLRNPKAAFPLAQLSANDAANNMAA